MSENKLNFPCPKDRKVEIFDDNYSMNIASGSVIISSEGSFSEDIPVNPACIVIDEKHIYLRRNWESWHTVNTTNKVFVKKLMESASCLIYDTVCGALQEFRIPIYKLSNFPERLFKKDELDAILDSKSKEGKNQEEGIENLVETSDILEMMPEKILNCAKALGVEIIPSVVVDGHCVDLAFTTENVSVFCGIFRVEDSSKGRKKEEDLHYVKADMSRSAPDAECHVALVTDIIDCFSPQYETTNMMTEDGLIEFLEKIFGNDKG